MVSGMNWRLFGALLLFVIANAACADDIVFSAAHLMRSGKGYATVDSSHLYRINENGTGLRQLTSGEESDTNPCVSTDRKRILFWRRNKDDLVGDIRLCSINFDGSDFRTLRQFDEIDLHRPMDLARLLAAYPGTEIRRAKPNRSGFDIVVRLPRGKQTLGDVILSPNCRFVRAYSHSADSSVLDLTTGRERAIEGIPSEHGGVKVAENIAWIDDKTLFHSYYNEDSLAAIASADGWRVHQLTIHQRNNGRSIEKAIFKSTQWATNPDGVKAFWFDTNHQRVLFQIVNRTEDGGEPAIYCIRRSDGLIEFQIGGSFLEDMKLDRTKFLLTTWQWGDGYLKEGTLPLRKLVIWDQKTLKPRMLGFDLACCEGACFLPTIGGQ